MANKFQVHDRVKVTDKCNQPYFRARDIGKVVEVLSTKTPIYVVYFQEIDTFAHMLEQEIRPA